MRRQVSTVAVTGAVLATGVFAAHATPAAASHPTVQHTLLISVDGLHESDLAWYTSTHPDSTLARLAKNGIDYTNAHTPVPSDSFPGMVGIATGGNPSSTGIYYDDTWNHALLPAGTTHCAGVKPGVEVTYFEALDKNPNALDAGQGLPGLPNNILQMTGNPDTVIYPANLPVDPASCTPVYPHQYLKVNTIFEVLRAAGLRTAWSDKHPAYEVLDGPSGSGVQDLFTPEINSNAPKLGDPNDWTTDNRLTMQYDNYKVEAVLNWIKGYTHSGDRYVGTPSIYGMNFQTVSTAEKLPFSDGLRGGYEADGVTPGPLLRRALNFVNLEIGRMWDGIRSRNQQNSTVIIITAKHGQSPQKPSQLLRIDDGAILNALDAAWQTLHPHAVNPLVAFAVDDDGMLIWLNDRSQQAADFAKSFLLGYSGTGNGINGNPRSFQHSGLRTVYAGEAAADYFHVQPGDPRVPDVLGISQVGVVYTSHMTKIAEHGGANPDDRDVALLVSGAPLGVNAEVQNSWVETTQVAPTVLRLFGLDPGYLEAVRIEHTKVLPGL